MTTADRFSDDAQYCREAPTEFGSSRARAVIGLSGSPASWHALAFACGWAERTGNCLEVAHVAPSTCFDSVDSFAAAAATECARQQAQALAREAAIWMRDRDLEWSFCTLLGSPALALERLARTRRAGTLIVGRSRPRRLRAGVAARLSRHADRIVIAVP